MNFNQVWILIRYEWINRLLVLDRMIGRKLTCSLIRLSAVCQTWEPLDEIALLISLKSFFEKWHSDRFKTALPRNHRKMIIIAFLSSKKILSYTSIEFHELAVCAKLLVSVKAVYCYLQFSFILIKMPKTANLILNKYFFHKIPTT